MLMGLCGAVLAVPLPGIPLGPLSVLGAAAVKHTTRTVLGSLPVRALQGFEAIN